MELTILISSFFLLEILGLPIAFALGISSLIVCLIIGLPITTLVNQTFHGINSFVLLAVPFFLIAGNLMNAGGITDRLTRLSRNLIGHIRGGLGHVNVLVSMIFAGLSGSAAADTAGVGAVLIPAMLKSGFDKGFCRSHNRRIFHHWGYYSPQLIVSFIKKFSLSYYGMYAVIILMLLLLGTFFSPIVIIIVFLPVIKGLGDIVQIHPVHLGVITVMVTAIGLITPPMACVFLLPPDWLISLL